MAYNANPVYELKALKSRLADIHGGALAAGRDLTVEETTELEAMIGRASELKSAIEAGQRNAAAMAELDGGAGDIETDAAGQIISRSLGAKGFITPGSIKRMVRTSAAGAAKALVAGGSSATPVALDTNPIKLGQPGANLGLLNVLQVKVRETPAYSYLRQTVRTNNAAVVAAGAQKPTSVLTVEEVNNSLDVVAHLSEYVDTYLLADNDNLESFIDSELRDGIFAKVTALAVAEFAGTSGILTQAFTDNAMDSIYLGASQIGELGYAPDVVLLSRATFDAIQLAKDADGNYLYRKAEDSRLNGLYPVIATGLTAGTALVLDSSKVGISIDKQGVNTKWDAISRFDYNEARALVEGRFAFDVFAAPAIAEVEVVDPTP